MTLADLIADTGLPADTPLTTLPSLTWHITKPLARQGITTLGQLAAFSDQDLLTLPGIGAGRLAAIKAAIERRKP